MNRIQQTFQTSSAPFWYAQLELGFCYENSRTIMSHRKHYGPVRVQKSSGPKKLGFVMPLLFIHRLELQAVIILLFKLKQKGRRML